MTEQIYTLVVVYRPTLLQLAFEARRGDEQARHVVQIANQTIMAAEDDPRLFCGCCDRRIERVNDVEAVLVAVPDVPKQDACGVGALLCEACGEQDWDDQRPRLLNMLRSHVFPDLREMLVHRTPGHA